MTVAFAMFVGSTKVITS